MGTFVLQFCLLGGGPALADNGRRWQFGAVSGPGTRRPALTTSIFVILMSCCAVVRPDALRKPLKPVARREGALERFLADRAR